MDMRWLVAIVALAGLSSDATAEARRKSFEEIVNAPIVLEVPGARDATVRADVRYSDADPHLFLDVYTPAASKRGDRRPLVLFIHGGAGAESRPKDWGIYKSWGRAAAASGFTAITFNHRLDYPNPMLRESGIDVVALIDHVRAHAAEYGADPDRICLAAYSAGGPLLTLGLDGKRPFIRCVVAFYAFLDLQRSKLHLEHEPAERVRAFSPVAYLDDGYARGVPVFVGRAGLDEIPDMNASIDRFIARAIEVNANVVVWNHPTGVHTFDNQNDDARSREILRAALDFMKTHLQ